MSRARRKCFFSRSAAIEAFFEYVFKVERIIATNLSSLGASRTRLTLLHVGTCTAHHVVASHTHAQSHMVAPWHTKLLRHCWTWRHHTATLSQNRIRQRVASIQFRVARRMCGGGTFFIMLSDVKGYQALRICVVGDDMLTRGGHVPVYVGCVVHVWCWRPSSTCLIHQ